MSDNPFASISFKELISQYTELQAKVVKQVQTVAKSISSATPGKFLLLQFSMSQITQIGESISNLVSQVQAMIMNMVRNQKGS